MRLHWLGHVPFEDAANIGAWAEQHGHTVTATRLYADEPLPGVREIDALAIMGGPMNVYQHRRYPWLLAEKRFIEQALRAEIPIIGVCLGAQLVADVLGAKVSENNQIEIGWFPVRMTDAVDPALLGGPPAAFTAFHWHGDTFEIPAGATRLAESDACPHQAFAYGPSVLALQFHLEYSADSIAQMLTHCGEELIDAPFIQTPAQIRAGLPHVEAATQRLFALLDRWGAV
ncbi:MAG: type 1 glutamine amidotransferase [Sedimentisphaerales bacterium]|nr:type 1 glutamine amidotransferase [Sedimentisphaerales bacterium]